MTSRRDFLKGLAALTGASAGSTSLLEPSALAQSAEDPRFLIVLCAGGGGSIVDGPLAIRASECATPDVINTFPDQLVTGWDGSPFRAVDLEGDDIGPIPAKFKVTPSEFFARRRQEMMVSTWTRTSVNHHIGQRRSVTGNEAWRGRTMQEIVAWQYGLNAPIPNVPCWRGWATARPAPTPPCRCTHGGSWSPTPPCGPCPSTVRWASSTPCPARCWRRCGAAKRRLRACHRVRQGDA